MAKIQTDVVVLNFSRLVKTGEEKESIITEEIASALEQVAQELIGSAAVVEIELT